MSADYLERIATELWEGRTSTIALLKTLGEQELNAIEATIQKFGRSISLRGTPEHVRDTLLAARTRICSQGGL